jgi:hypothetical protein
MCANITINLHIGFDNNFKFIVQYITVVKNLPRNSKFLLLAIIAALSKKWHANRDRKLLRSSIKIERMMPHCNTGCQRYKNGVYFLKRLRKSKILIISYDVNKHTHLFEAKWHGKDTNANNAVC